MHGSLLFCCLRDDLFKKKSFRAIGALGFTFVRDDEQATAFWTWLFDWFFPRSEIAVWIIDTTVKCAAFARLAFDNFATIFRTSDTNLFEPGFGVTTCRKIGA